MSLGIKTAQGIQRIHSVRIKPSTVEKTITANGTYDASDDGVDGYSAATVNVNVPGSSDEEIMVNIGTYNLRNESAVLLVKGSASTYCLAANAQFTYNVVAKIVGYTEGYHASKIDVNLGLHSPRGSADVNTMYNSTNGSIIYPNAFENYYGINFSGNSARMYRDRINSIHPVMTEIYNLPRNDWFNFSTTAVSLKKIYNLLTSIKDRALIYDLGDTYGLYFYDYEPKFELENNVYRDRVVGNCERCQVPGSFSAYTDYSDVVNVNSETVTSTNLYYDLNSVLATTFDMRDLDGNVIKAKNIEIEDLVDTV